MGAPPRRGARLLAAAGAGCLMAGLVAHLAWLPATATDFEVDWRGAQDLLRGVDPFIASWDYTTPEFPWALVHPPPALLVALPFAGLNLLAASIAFVALSAGLLAYAVTARAWWPLLILLSGPAVQAFWLAQWPPIVTAGFLLPGLGWLLAARPHLGLALWCASPSVERAWRLALWVLGAYAVSTIILPGWPASYLVALAPQPHQPIVLRPWGWILLLAAFRWRDPAGRLLLALALVPQVGFFYDGLPLFLTARSALQGAFYAGVSLAGYLAWHHWVRTPDFFVTVEAGWPLVLATVYLPALGLLAWNSVPGAPLERGGERAVGGRTAWCTVSACGWSCRPTMRSRRSSAPTPRFPRAWWTSSCWWTMHPRTPRSAPPPGWASPAWSTR